MRGSVRRRFFVSFCLGRTVYLGAPREVVGLGMQAGVGLGCWREGLHAEME